MKEWTEQKIFIDLALARSLISNDMSAIIYLFEILIDQMFLTNIGRYEKKEQEVPHGAFIDCSIYRIHHTSKTVDLKTSIQLTGYPVLRNEFGFWERAADELITHVTQRPSASVVH